MTEQQLHDEVARLADELGVPGVSAGVLVGEEEHYAHVGVTSVDNPLPVDAGTLFQFGSTGKTYTATALMALHDRGELDLDAPVRTYVPELRLADEDVAARVTVLQLLNHTAGWDGDCFDDTGDGDDALERYVARMATLEQVTPLGATVSYNNAAVCLAGRVVERVTGSPYEEAVADLLLRPLGLTGTYYRPAEVMTRRFVVGHELRPGEDRPRVLRPWAMPRSCAPAGSTCTATAHDQLAWARFHLGDGTAPSGERVLTTESLRRMQQPSVEIPAGALGDAVGIAWLLQLVGGETTVRHGGTTHGQHSAFVMVPSRGFAVVCLSNCEPNGPQLNDAVVAWALEHHLGLTDAPPELAEPGPEALAAYVGTYDTIAVTVTVEADGGGLSATPSLKPAALAMLTEAGQDPAQAKDEQERPIPLGLLAAGQDQYVVTDGPGTGMRGYFVRDGDGRVSGVHLGGRLATRVD